MNSMVLDDVIKSQVRDYNRAFGAEASKNHYLNPYILEERQLNVT